MQAHSVLITLAASFSIAAPAAFAAGAPQFSVIATVSGTPAIGAISGTTLYGTLPSSPNGAGGLFSLTTGGVYTLLHAFVAATDGDTPNARLALGSGGSVWGTAQSGGTYGGGTLFSWGASGFSVPHSFGGSKDGSEPLQGPVAGVHGTMFGTNAGGAMATNGNLFTFGGGKYLVLHNFLSGSDGHCPFSGPARAYPSGTLYGTTVGHGYGGNPNGSVWSYKAGTLTTIYLFTNGADGEWPDQAPITDTFGNIYGTTHVQSGNNFAGAIWKIDASGVFSVLHDLVAGSDGYAPNSPLVLNTNGYLYGTTAAGGAHNAGTVFRISRTGKFSVEHDFTGGADGANPTGSLVHDASGAIYGATASGTVFKITD